MSVGHRTEVQADSPHPQVKREGEGACSDVLDVLERTEYHCRVDCMLEEGVEALSVFYPSGNSIAEGNGTPLQHSCLANPMDGGAWWAAVHGVAKSRT